MSDETGSSISYEIFLSYSRKDANNVVKFKAQLEGAGINPIWFDKERINGGEEWRESITDAIDASKVLILCATQNSVDSRVVQKEVAYAHRHGTPVLFVYLGVERRNVKLPKKLDFEFGDDDYKKHDPEDETVAFPILRTLAENHDVPSTVYDDYLARRKARNADTARQIDLLPNLINRTDQTEDYQRFVAVGKKKLGNGQPWLTLIHGPKPQMIVEFRRALVGHHLKAVLKKENFVCRTPTQKKAFNITAGQMRNRKPDALTMKMAGPFGCSLGAQTQDIANYFSINDQVCHVVVFHVHVEDRDLAAFKRFIKFFCKYWKDFPSVGKSAVIVKLAVSYAQPRRRSKVGKFCDSLNNGKSFGSLHRCVLPELANVPDLEAELWMDEEEVSALLEKLRCTAKTKKKIASLYQERQTDSLPMSLLAPELRDWLHEQLYKQT